ncbi:phage shock protein A (PspA) family protein [Paenibacillus sp. UNCCL117]|uniref:PspA/IM30 family protein n=1 Tax=unclassified Paenibacillus TaxID=185978 RepID=UPI00088E5F33|nr:MULTISPECIES: PspA/IM30 family protein [unclassified Paenibacillus]SDC44347.1 phage shock protein A (PspA) family protein [Paenibacillus sp. cl123]SFW12757.1 phage shock protein A (PspA) family protein [Paenibacillus sp. UNCCL117]
MGIISRFKSIMASNIHAILDKADDPEKTIDDFMRSMSSDLGQVKAETAAMQAEERRAKRALDEASADIGKLQRYADKAAESGDEDAARRFLEKKAELSGKTASLQAAYDQAATNAGQMRQMQDKLAADLGALEERRTRLKGTLAAARAQQKVNDLGSPLTGKHGVFEEMEKKANLAYEEAMAIAELRAEPADTLDEELARLDKHPDEGATSEEKAAEAPLRGTKKE